MAAQVLRRPRPARIDTAAAIAAELARGPARRVLDIGCGDGRIAAHLCRQGHEVTGIDPSPDRIAQAQGRAPAARFLVAGAEALPAGLGPFDAAIFVNALHHVAPARMDAALSGALSVLAPGGRLLVCEPAAAGSFFRVMQPVEDETEARARARAAVEALIAARRAELVELRRWERETEFPGLEAFVALLVAADPGRAAQAQQNAARLRRAWRENIELRDGKAVLTQPIVCWVLRAGDFAPGAA